MFSRIYKIQLKSKTYGHNIIGPERFSRFDVYWTQTETDDMEMLADLV